MLPSNHPLCSELRAQSNRLAYLRAPARAEAGGKGGDGDNPPRGRLVVLQVRRHGPQEEEKRDVQMQTKKVKPETWTCDSPRKPPTLHPPVQGKGKGSLCHIGKGKDKGTVRGKAKGHDKGKGRLTWTWCPGQWVFEDEWGYY